jgi:TetR/AcrR family transcriptional regulator
VGVSEAALYRHFPSKARMFESLIAFAEDSVFGLVNRVLAEDRDPSRRCERILRILLGFAERNPGITRVLLGDALVGENERLQERVGQFFDRVETQLRQVLREGEASVGLAPASASDPLAAVSALHALAERPGPLLALPVAAAASLLLAFAEGRMSRYIRSRFRRPPLEAWDEQWPRLAAALFRE